VFVVDRKDLDRQTREEFNKFQEKCVEENTHTGALVRRLLSDDYADKVIVTTIQKLGLALDEDSKRNKENKKAGKATYKEQLAPLRGQRMVFIFDECHRSQFGDNHQTIKEFFPNSQLFGFTGTPIFPENATQQQVTGQVASLKTTKDLFQKELHAYTITHAIEDKNVLRFHVDYYKADDENVLRDNPYLTKPAIVEAILGKHDAATSGRKFNALLATASINDAIEYFNLFTKLQAGRQKADPAFQPLNIGCVFSPPAQLAQTPEEKKDIAQLAEDLVQEKADNQQDPEGKKAALKSIIADYNQRFDTNHTIGDFDLYYQDVQQRIKDQKYPNRDLPLKGREKLDIVIVVDMLLTGFDSQYLNTLYVDKNLKYHGLIQAFSRTNRILNATKPYGNILDFRQQKAAVEEAITLFSGTKIEQAREIWLVEKAPAVIKKLESSVRKLGEFMKSQGLACQPQDVPKLKGDDARSAFINQFKEVQRLKTQLDQYTDLTEENASAIEQVLPKDQLNAFRGVYLETAQRLKEQQKRDDGTDSKVQELEFEFVLFASAVIDYDYIMALIARYSAQAPGKQKLTREQLIGLIQGDAKFMDERDDIRNYINTLKVGEALSEKAIRDGYQQFKAEKNAKELAAVAAKHGLELAALQSFVDGILQRMIFDGEQLTDLMEPLGLNWKNRRVKELALMEDLVPLLNKRAQGREISGLSAYGQ
jgi:type I restriction enzyme R subunit